MVNVICMKWGTKYDASYVNILYSMVRRNLGLRHRFVCFTDDPDGVRDEVETFPLPVVELPDGLPERGWRKLGTFHRQLADLEGTALFLDLDVVVVDRLDAFFDPEGSFFISHDWRWYGKQRVTGNSSCYRFEVGRHPEVIEDFQRDFDRVRSDFRHEQAYLSHKMKELGALQYWPDAWCRSFKAHCLPRLPLRYFVRPRIPPGARVVMFHGHPKPPEAARAGFRSLRKAWRPAAWVERHWTEEPTASQEPASRG